MTINAHTKIAAILKAHPDALEAIIGISPKFSKLRIPLLRKTMAALTSVQAASRVAGCTVEDFYKNLEPLGFTADRSGQDKEDTSPPETPSLPVWMNNAHIDTLDVRPVIEKGQDPFHLIMKKIQELPAGAVLKISNSFEPVPLIGVLGKKGFASYVQRESENLVHTFFCKPAGEDVLSSAAAPAAQGWEEIWNRFRERLVEVDVRYLEMPQPMMTILTALDKLPVGCALYVHHKRIPVFLLPELEERRLEYRVKEVADGEVYLLIFHRERPETLKQ